ncbi:hypothetical protein ACF0H5_008417 [Mactra antiquata]
MNDFVENEFLQNFDILPDDYTQDEFMHRITKDLYVNDHGRKMILFCKETGIRIMNGRIGDLNRSGNFTCVKESGCSVVDYVLCKPNLLPFFESFYIHDPNIISDHCAISFSLKCVSSICNVGIEQPKNHERLNYTYRWDSSKHDEFIQNISDNDFQSCLNNLSMTIENESTSESIEHNLNGFYQLLEKACDPLFKRNTNTTCTKNTVTSNQPWFDDECKDSRKSFYNNLNTFRTNNNDRNRKLMTNSRSSYKNIIRKKKFEFSKNQSYKLESLRNKNSKEYWKMLKNMGKPEPKCNITVTEFSKYFKAINDPESRFFQADEDVLHFNDRFLNNEFQVMFSELDNPISTHEVSMACKQLKLDRSCGPDLVLNEFFKHGFNHLSSYIVKLFNKLFNMGIIPSHWTEGFIIPLHKKHDLNQPGNYRGITLLSTFGKLFTRVLNNRLNKWAEDYSIYVEAQAGFRQNMGTTDNLFIVNGLISHVLNEKSKLFVCFVDFTKAFDYLVRQNIFYKLIKYGIRGKMLNIIKSLYTEVKSRVKYKNDLGDNFECFLGVRQGDCLSPFIFSMYINDLEEHMILNGFKGVGIGMLKLFLLLYADDIVIFADTPDSLQNGLTILKEYCDKWKLVVNVQKTKILIFKKGGTIRLNYDFTYDGQTIEIVSKFSYLGITFSNSGSYKHTIDTLSGQAIKAIYKMKSYLYKFVNISVKHRLELFDKLILPILNYGAEVWGHLDASPIENIHLKFCKELLNVRKQTQNNFVYGELGRVPLKVNRLIHIIRYWLKIANCNENKYIKCIYNMMLHDIDTNPGKINWALNVKNTLQNLGFYEVWFFQGVGNVSHFLHVFNSRIKDNYLQLWNTEINNSSRASSYILFSNFEFKKYLDIVHINKYRYALSRLRMSSHKLNIETGRWHKPQKIPKSERKCQICNSLEDEFHFILECSIYTDYRKQHISKYYWQRPNIPKFVELMSSENKKTIINLSYYVYKSFKRRDELLIR